LGKYDVFTLLMRGKKLLREGRKESRHFLSTIPGFLGICSDLCAGLSTMNGITPQNSQACQNQGSFSLT
jgi:hypothetical protein